MAFVWQGSSSPTDDSIEGGHENISEWYPGDEYVDLLEDRVTLFRGRFEDLDKALGRSRFYFVRMLQNPSHLRLDDFLKATETLGFHPSEYLKRLQGDHRIFAELPPRFLESRRRRDRKPSRFKDLKKLSLWATLVRIDPAGKQLRLTLKPYLELLGDQHPQNEEIFGKALLEVLTCRQPGALTPQTAVHCCSTLITLAKHSTGQGRCGEALEILSIAFCLAQKCQRYDIKAEAFFATADTLSALGFTKDASWCAYEGTLLAIGTGSFERVSQGLDLYDGLQKESDDHVNHVIACAVDERRASSFTVAKSTLDQPLTEAGISFSRLATRKQRSKLSVEHWKAFTDGFVTPLKLNRALRTPFVPQAGNTFLRAYLGHLEQEPCSTEHDSYLAWISAVAIQPATDEEPTVSFNSVDHAQEILSQKNHPDELSRADAFTHTTALATCAHHYRLTGNHPLAFRLFNACFELESRVGSLPLRSHLLRLSAYLFRDTGFLLEAHLSSWRSLHCALAGRDAYALSHATYTTATLHMLFDEYEEATWLLRGCLELSESSPAFFPDAPMTPDISLVRFLEDPKHRIEKLELDHLNQALEALILAEHPESLRVFIWHMLRIVKLEPRLETDLFQAWKPTAEVLAQLLEDVGKDGAPTVLALAQDQPTTKKLLDRLFKLSDEIGSFERIAPTDPWERIARLPMVALLAEQQLDQLVEAVAQGRQWKDPSEILDPAI